MVSRQGTHQVKPLLLQPVHHYLKCFVGDLVKLLILPIIVQRVEPFLIYIQSDDVAREREDEAHLAHPCRTQPEPRGHSREALDTRVSNLKYLAALWTYAPM